MTDSPIKVELPSTADEFVKMVRAVDADRPKRADIDALQNHFADNPQLACNMANLAAIAVGNLINASFNVQSMRMAVIEKCIQMRKSMGWDNAGAVERSLIEHCVLCWLRLYDAELKYHGMMQSQPTMQQGAYWEKKLSANQRRYLRAIETLERVRKLMRPEQSPIMAMMLKQQINMG